MVTDEMVTDEMVTDEMVTDEMMGWVTFCTKKADTSIEVVYFLEEGLLKTGLAATTVHACSVPVLKCQMSNLKTYTYFLAAGPRRPLKIFQTAIREKVYENVCIKMN